MTPESDPVTHALEDVLEVAGAVTSGEVASYIPELAKVDPEPFAISLIGVLGTSIHAGDDRGHLHDPVDLQAVRLCTCAVRTRRRRGPRPRRVRAERGAVQRDQPGRVRTPGESDDQRRGHRHLRTHRRADAGRAVRADPGDAVGVRRARAATGRARLRVGVRQAVTATARSRHLAHSTDACPWTWRTRQTCTSGSARCWSLPATWP